MNTEVECPHCKGAPHSRFCIRCIKGWINVNNLAPFKKPKTARQVREEQINSWYQEILQKQYESMAIPKSFFGPVMRQSHQEFKHTPPA